MKHLALVIVLATFTSVKVNAESLNEKVARNAANCLIGHAATESEKYQSGETSRYILLIEQILGSEKGLLLIKETSDSLASAVRMLGSTNQEEGSFLISEYCPGVDKIISQSK